MRLLPLSVALLLVSSTCFGQSTKSTGDYYIDLGQIYGAIEYVKNYQDICADAFPALRKTNADAYVAWRSKHIEFLQEVEKNWSTSTWQQSKGDPSKYSQLLAKIDTANSQYKEESRKRLVSAGAEKFQEACSLYPRFLASDVADIERYFSEQVQTMRKGPR